MRVRALTLIVLVAAWMVPGTGWSCPSSGPGPEAQAHDHPDEATPHSHTRADPDHGKPHPAATGTFSDPARELPADDPTCCNSGSDLPAVQALIKHAQPRPKLSLAALSALLAVPAARATGAQVRRQQPPPLPYARTRRPLLI